MMDGDDTQDSIPVNLHNDNDYDCCLVENKATALCTTFEKGEGQPSPHEDLMLVDSMAAKKKCHLAADTLKNSNQVPHGGKGI
jgi:hypothetical protein